MATLDPDWRRPEHEGGELVAVNDHGDWRLLVVSEQGDLLDIPGDENNWPFFEDYAEPDDWERLGIRTEIACTHWRNRWTRNKPKPYQR